MLMLSMSSSFPFSLVVDLSEFWPWCVGYRPDSFTHARQHCTSFISAWVYMAPLTFVVMSTWWGEQLENHCVKTSMEDWAVLVNVTGRRIKLESHLCALSGKAFLKLGYHLVSFLMNLEGSLSFQHNFMQPYELVCNILVPLSVIQLSKWFEIF